MYEVQRYLSDHPASLVDVRGDQHLDWCRSEKRGPLPPTIGEVVGALGVEVDAGRAEYVPGRGWRSLLDQAARDALVVEVDTHAVEQRLVSDDACGSGQYDGLGEAARA